MGNLEIDHRTAFLKTKDFSENTAKIRIFIQIDRSDTTGKRLRSMKRNCSSSKKVFQILNIRKSHSISNGFRVNFMSCLKMNQTVLCFPSKVFDKLLIPQ